MKKKANKDVLETISRFKRYLDKKPPASKMYEEIQMMKFRVRPLHGDLANVNLKNEKFIEALWSLGKLDEFFQREFYQLSSKNKNLFLKIFDDIYEKYQQDLNKVSLEWEKTPREKHFLEVEIFKEIKGKKVN